ncbi:SidA protein, substrate of the Dot/Icm transport system [Legionella santicrucis]|uniref:SidA protein, substrate of the Dot/Icm transport system n=1 Tax=Legionella santicrucis TaxID=45074 RepID=A0A0W0YFR9_9GAMM|nr:T4SS effector SidA family protein [Legionella santicrucis]KTD55800.1 SidA protein, substrate of the Dot/Icm transport system [Legionella santicrucis]
MTYPHKKHIVLSEQMNELKNRITQLQQQQKLSFIEKINKRGNLSKFFLDGVQKILDFVTSIITSSKELPIIGFVMRMISAIPNAITTLTDKKSSVGSKILATTLLLVTTGFGIAAFVLGGIVSAGIGLAFASLGTLIEGISLLSSIIEKYQSAKAYKEKKIFMDLMEKRDLSALDDTYRERLEIRALELKFLLNKPNSLFSERMEEELEFINTIRAQKGWKQLPFSDDSLPSKLLGLYQERDEMLLYLKKMIQIIEKEDMTGTTVGNSQLIELVSNLQHEITQIDEDIEKITEPLHKLKQQNLLANETIAKSYTNFALGGVGVILSVIGLMVLISAFAAPPLAGTILFGFGIGLASFGLIKWGVEQYANKEDKKLIKERTKEHEDTILEEALDCYEHELSKEYQHEGKCSYSTSLRNILLSSKTKEDVLESKDLIKTSKASAPKEPEEKNRSFSNISYYK